MQQILIITSILKIKYPNTLHVYIFFFQYSLKHFLYQHNNTKLSQNFENFCQCQCNKIYQITGKVEHPKSAKRKLTIITYFSQKKGDKSNKTHILHNLIKMESSTIIFFFTKFPKLNKIPNVFFSPQTIPLDLTSQNVKKAV